MGDALPEGDGSDEHPNKATSAVIGSDHAESDTHFPRLGLRPTGRNSAIRVQGVGLGLA